MIQEYAPIRDVTNLGSDIYRLTFRSNDVARAALPGQFVNIRSRDEHGPLLRRPFSISSVERDDVSILFNVIGPGTTALAAMRSGEQLDVIGPLGRGTFPCTDPDFETAVLVAGGLGVAPMPFLRASLPEGKKSLLFIGARSASQLVTVGLEGARVATDDGSEGYRGTVVDLLTEAVDERELKSPRIFACGPLPMLRALRRFAMEKHIECFVALECEMACGIGLCQGCPVESANEGRKYVLVCSEGPVFESSRVRF